MSIMAMAWVAVAIAVVLALAIGYAQQWINLQERFVDAPGPAVTEADELVTAAMAERGYPTETSSSNSRTCRCTAVPCTTTRQAHEISRRATSGEASTEDLRQAMVHYRVLFEELLGNSDGDGHHPQPAEARQEQPALADGSQQR
ncbi:hypothetical protein [Nonomuraea zeae]|uniref:hypothetical protein n=1 Tax=Nonomuraea zeae TaxID=1642303 RepID=UPI001F10AFA7|nr:hypothetical protein [Nonomuraea zeae]